MIEASVLVFGEKRSGSRLFTFTDGITVDIDAREQRQRLERIAFGRTHGRDDEAAAAAARKELAEADRAARVTAGELATRLQVLPNDSGSVEPPVGTAAA